MLGDKKKMNRGRFHEKVWRVLDSIESKNSKEAVIDYLDFLIAKKSAKHNTILSNARTLRNLANTVETSLSEVNATDLQRYFSNGTKMAQTSKYTYQAILKGFYRHHLGKGREYPENVEWIKVRRTEIDRKARDMLTKEDIRKLVDACTNPRDKAIVVVLYESGFRLSEFLALRIGDIDFDDRGIADIVLPKDATSLKTGRREITIVESVPYLQMWIENHPDRENSRAPLWPAIYGNRGDKTIHERSLPRILRRIQERAGIDKDVSPHAFRHSRATESARIGWNESQMRAFFGWSKRSTMPSHYTHLANQDVKNKVLEDHGIKKKETVESPLATKECFKCKTKNGADAVFCSNCGRPLSAEDLKELERREKVYNQRLTDHIKSLSPEEIEKLTEIFGLLKQGQFP